VNLLLVTIFACVVLGLAAHRIGRRQQVAIALLATAVTTAYFGFTRAM
jgi:hypothetical protein